MRATTNQTVFDDFRIKFTVLCEMTSALDWEGGSARESNCHASMRTWVYTPAAMSISALAASTCIECWRVRDKRTLQAHRLLS